MSEYGLWRNLVAILIPKKSGAKSKAVFASNAGRIIYEEFDPSIKKPSEKSKFYVVKTAEVSSLEQNKSGQILQLTVDLNQETFCKELVE